MTGYKESHIHCGCCGQEIDREEYEENASPECYHCGVPLCLDCIVYGTDENMRCIDCADKLEAEDD